MIVFVSLFISLVSAISVSITEPIDGDTYDGNWLPFRAIVENDNEIPDSVHYSLNGSPSVQTPRLNTDWYTYMANELRTAYSEAPAPHDNTILWSAPITGFLHEFPTPVTYCGMVFYTSDSIGQATTNTLYALDAATGSVIWTYDTGYADDAVTVVDGRLYTSADSIFCLDAYTGEKYWAYDDTCQTFFNSHGPPVLWQDKVYATSGSVYCLDIMSGEMLWKTDQQFGCACSMTAWNEMLFVPTFQEHSLYALDVTDGSVIWQNTDCPSGYWDSSPLIEDGMVYICGAYGYALAIDAVTGTTEWISTLTGEVTATPAFHDDQLFFASEIEPYYCLDALNGSTVWTAPYNQHGSSGIADGLVFFGETQPTHDSASVVALDIETGSEVWSYRTSCNPNLGFQSSPSITDGVMYYACTDGYLYAFGTGLKYTYKEDFFYADLGANELIVTSWDDGITIASDTINFMVTQTGITLEPSRHLNLHASPNPFKSSAAISFELTDPGFVTLKVFDLTGRSVTTLLDNELVRGEHSVQWNCCCENKQPVSSGLYFCRIESQRVIETIGLCLLN
ncbi:MAG: PQQ-binding-like beta-propeller repeat protein [Candidatus Sabulitectum sp.]|nr:PQQ-binding-like beta-propeller repeat protein [Candidatus Sabulitectum sp.]